MLESLSLGSSSWRKIIVAISGIPNNFCFTFLFLFLYSVLKVRGAPAPGVIAFSSLLVAVSYSRLRSPAHLKVYTPFMSWLAPSPAAIANFAFAQFYSRRGSGGSPLVGSNGLEPSTSRLSGARSNHLSYEPIYVAGRVLSANLFACGSHSHLRRVFDFRFRSIFPASWVWRLATGGDEQNRTVDPLLARQVLSQLSYAPILGLPLSLGESTILSAFFVTRQP